MQVWIVEERIPYDSSRIRGVFSSFANAKALCEKLEAVAGAGEDRYVYYSTSHWEVFDDGGLSEGGAFAAG